MQVQGGRIATAAARPQGAGRPAPRWPGVRDGRCRATSCRSPPCPRPTGIRRRGRPTRRRPRHLPDGAEGRRRTGAGPGDRGDAGDSRPAASRRRGSRPSRPGGGAAMAPRGGSGGGAQAAVSAMVRGQSPAAGGTAAPSPRRRFPACCGGGSAAGATAASPPRSSPATPRRRPWPAAVVGLVQRRQRRGLGPGRLVLVGPVTRRDRPLDHQREPLLAPVHAPGPRPGRLLVPLFPALYTR